MNFYGISIDFDLYAVYAFKVEMNCELNGKTFNM